MSKNYVMSNELRRELLAFNEAARKLSERWTNEVITTDLDLLADHYPFPKSFDETVSDINNWVATNILYDKLRAAVGVDKHYPILMLDGVAIGDPFISACGRYEVDPIEEYGFKEIIEAVRKLDNEGVQLI